MIWLALLFTAAAGWVLLRPWLRSGPVIGLCVGFTAGAAALSLQLLLYDLARIPWRRWTVLGPWVVAFGVFLYKRRPARPRWRWPQPMELAALAFAVVALMAWVPYERLMPLNEWDAVMLWMFKGKAFYLDGGVAPYLRRAQEFLANPAYPLLVPLYSTFLYICVGAPADHAAKLLSPCFFASLLGGFYYLLRRFGSRPVAAVFTAMLLGVYMLSFVAFHYAGYADTAVTAAIVLGAGFLYAWWREEHHADFALAALFASIAAWGKNEGQFFLAGAGALAAGRLLWRRQWNWRLWTRLAVFPLLAVAPWVAARGLYGIRRPGQLSTEIVQTNVASYLPTLKALIEHAFAPSVFNLAFPMLLLAVALHRRAGLDAKFLLLPALVAWQMLGVAWVYITGPISLQWMIGSSLDRVLSQIVPLALLSAAVVFASYYDRAEARLAAPAPPAKAKKRVR